MNEAIPAPPKRRALRWLGGGIATVVALAAIAVGVLLWGLHSARGSAWLLTLAPQLKVVAPKGSLLGDFSADRIDIALPGASHVLRLDAPRWHALDAARGDRGRWLRLTIDTLHADRITLLSTETPSTASSAPATPPATLRLPVEIEIREASVDELRLGAADDATRLLGLRGRVHLGDDGGAIHRFESLAARYEQADASGRASIAADAPFAVDARLLLAYGNATPAWQANAEATGPLDALRVKATVHAVAAASGVAAPAPAASSTRAAATAPSIAASSAPAAPSLDASALVRPFAPWPLGELHATTSSLDISAFSRSAPATSLSGEADIATSGIDRPATILVDLRNARAGRWNEGLLPVRRLHADLRARPDAPSVLDVQTLTGELGTVQSAAGNVAAHGRWSPQGWNVEAMLEKVRPNGLDARAPDSALDGKLTATGDAPQGIAITADVTGPLPDRHLPRAAPRLAHLRVDARIGELALELRHAEARLGDATATLEMRATRPSVAAPWHAAGRFALAGFDPAPWWPGSPDSLLSRGANRLDAHGDFDLALPRAFGDSVYEILAATRGKASLAVTDSVLAGVPFEGQAAFVNGDGAARETVELVAAGNRVEAHGQIAASASGDAWSLDIDAPQLGRLAPLLRAAGAAAPGAAASGASAGGVLTAKATVHGRWPSLTSEGELHASAIRFDALAVRQADAHWTLGSAANAPIDGALTLDGASVAGRVVEQVRARLSGTARAHRLELDIASEALPPGWVDAVTARAADAAAPAVSASATTTPKVITTTTVAAAASAPPVGRSTVSLRAEGGFVDVGGATSAGWSGTVHELVAQSTAAPTRTWLHASELRGSVLWSGGPARASVEPGTAETLGATVRWSRIAWQAGEAGSAARLDAQVTVDPMTVAPILRSLQPDFGWGGDLKVGARLNVRSAPTVMVDVVVQRASGDLSVTDEIGTQPLGFSDLRFGIAANDGVWNFTAALAGSTLGVASGAVTARTGSAATWPGAETPLQGVVELQVANLGTWGPWVPAGWRLAGALHASGSIGGRVGRPEYTGRIEGTRLGVRNFLQGVNVTDGDAAVVLQGSTARIEHFTAKGGSGTLQLEGDASFDAAPAARLKLVADKFQLLGRVDRSIVASGNAAMTIDAQSLGLDGAFKLDEGLIDFTRSDAPALGDDVEVVRRPAVIVSTSGVAGGAAAVGAAASAAAPGSAASAANATATSRKVALDLRVGMGEKLRIRGRGLDAGLRGELHLTSQNGKLAVNGTLNAVDGTYQAYGQKLGIDRGVITFAGPVENPRLDIEATRPNLDVRVGVDVIGTALNPRIRLFSEPDMTDIDKLSWLILGRASEGVGSNDTALLQSAALALLSGEGPGVTDRLTQAIGLDSFGVRQENVGEVKETIVTLGKQISKRWYVGYERGLNATTGSWQLIYRVAQRVTIRAQAGDDNAVDLIWTLRWK